MRLLYWGSMPVPALRDSCYVYMPARQTPCWHLLYFDEGVTSWTQNKASGRLSLAQLWKAHKE